MTEEETEAETEEVTEEETEAETEEVTEEETEAETEEVTEEETEAEKALYEAEDGSFVIVLPDNTWTDEEKGDKITFTSKDNSLTVEKIKVETAEKEMAVYPESEEDFADKTGWKVVKYQKESVGDVELVSACWQEDTGDDYSIVYYLIDGTNAYVLNGIAANKADAEDVYTAALSFKNIEE